MIGRQEKWLLAAAIVVFPLQAFAQPMGGSALRILSDPAYLPLAGQFEGNSAYHYGQTSGDVFDSTGAPDYTFHTIDNQISQSLQYGLTDDLSFQFAIAYDASQKRNNIFPDGSVITRTSNGFTDPSFGVTWRVIDEENAPVNLDLSASYQPDAFNAKIASPTEDGSIARGGQAAHFGAALSEVMQQFTIQGAVNANYYGGSSFDNLANDTSSKRDQYWTYDIGLASQVRLTDLFSINAGVSHTFNSNFNVMNITNDLASLSRPGDVTSFNAALNYHIVPNTFVVGLTYAYDMHANSQNVFPTETTLDTSTRSNNENIFGVRLQYVL
jgi:hypothetical protein